MDGPDAQVNTRLAVEICLQRPLWWQLSLQVPWITVNAPEFEHSNDIRGLEAGARKRSLRQSRAVQAVCTAARCRQHACTAARFGCPKTTGVNAVSCCTASAPSRASSSPAMKVLATAARQRRPRTYPQLLHHVRGVRHAKLTNACKWKSHPANAVAGRLGPSLAGVAATRGPKCRQGSCGVRD